MADALVDAVRRYTDTRTGASPFLTSIEGVIVLRSDHEKEPNHLIYKPAICLVVQGTKWTMFGERQFVYGAGKALVVSVETPAFGRVMEASPSDPYLGLIIQFDLGVMRDVMEGLTAPPEPSDDDDPGVFVIDFGGPLADCALRIVRLLDTPEAIPMLYPLIMREICYWLLTGPSGGAVARMVLASSHEQSIISAIHALRDRFAETVRIEDLAQTAQMSPSAFHRQFKALTSMTPLQYQKRLRLLEARRLMVADAANAETAAFQVGYESASQFSREYSRMFGSPPRRDIVGMRELVA